MQRLGTEYFCGAERRKYIRQGNSVPGRELQRFSTEYFCGAARCKCIRQGEFRTKQGIPTV